MNVGMYQSAASISALEKWQDLVAQNITSNDQTAYKKKTVSFSTEMAGEIQADARHAIGRGNGVPMLFPKINTGISFNYGESQRTRGELDVAIQGEGFFEVQNEDGSRIYTRNGQFRMRTDRTLVTSAGQEVMSTAGGPITFLPNGGAIVINENGTVMQGTVAVGRLALYQFPDNSQLISAGNGYYLPPQGVEPEEVENPELLQGYVEGSNTSSLREMVDLVLISRAYEANQKMITTIDEQMGKALDALG